MGVMMKGDKDILTIMMKGDGPINGVTVTADSHGNVKGYVGNPNVLIPANYAGKLDVGAAIGYGTLTVIKDMGLKEPYSSQVPLGTSEVAEDLTYYFATSEQVPSAVGLGVLMSKDNTVKQAGGFIVQLMPFADEETIQALEDRISKITSVTDMLEKGMTPEDILKEVMGDMDVEFTDKIDTQFKCTCSKEKIVKALAGTPCHDARAGQRHGYHSGRHPCCCPAGAGAAASGNGAAAQEQPHLQGADGQPPLHGTGGQHPQQRHSDAAAGAA